MSYRVDCQKALMMSSSKGLTNQEVSVSWLLSCFASDFFHNGVKIFLELYYNFQGSPPWSRGGALDLWSKGQWFEPRRRQLEKVVNLDENSWTPTKIIKKRSLCSDCQVDRADGGLQWAPIPHSSPAFERSTFAKHKYWWWDDNAY